MMLPNWSNYPTVDFTLLRYIILIPQQGLFSSHMYAYCLPTGYIVQTTFLVVKNGMVTQCSNTSVVNLPQNVQPEHYIHYILFSYWIILEKKVRNSYSQSQSYILVYKTNYKRKLYYISVNSHDMLNT